ncbi:MAG: T9SS type A sorting domain-containing protein, partial [Bacteroidales bacterium]
MWQITQSGNNLYVDDDIYAFTPTLNTHYVITGIIHFSFDDWKILPRNADDVVIYEGIENTENNNINLYYDANSKNIIVKGLQTDADLEVINILGQNLITFNLSPSNINKVDISNFNSGIYILNLHNKNNIITKKIIVP